jgi:uncharacterized protein (TIGR02001 family)
MQVRTSSNLLTALLVAGAVAGVPTAAHAEWTPSANVALTSDYVFRGISQTDEDPAIQGGFDLGHDSGFYVGTWASNVDFADTSADDADMELDVYLGFAGEYGDVSYDVGLLRYIYPGTDVDIDYNELIASVGYMGATFLIGYSNDVFNSSETGIYYNLSYEHEVVENVSVNAGVGYYDFDKNVYGPGMPDSYMDYTVGVSTEFAGIGFGLAWTDTNDDGEDLAGDWADGRAVLTISKEM